MQKVLGAFVFQVLPARKSFHCGGPQDLLSNWTGRRTACWWQWPQTGLWAVLAGLPQPPRQQLPRPPQLLPCLPPLGSWRTQAPFRDNICLSPHVSLLHCREGGRGELCNNTEADGQFCLAGTPQKWQV